MELREPYGTVREHLKPLRHKAFLYVFPKFHKIYCKRHEEYVCMYVRIYSYIHTYIHVKYIVIREKLWNLGNG